MHTTLSKKLALLAPLAMFSLMLAVPAAVDAQTTTPGVIPDPRDEQYGLGSQFQEVGLGKDRDLKSSLANIINIILGFLGIVAVIIILAGGFKWMTSSGNEEKVGEARQMIIQGIIGLVVVFAAWAIASFVISNLQSVTT